MFTKLLFKSSVFCLMALLLAGVVAACAVPLLSVIAILGIILAVTGIVFANLVLLINLTRAMKSRGPARRQSNPGAAVEEFWHWRGPWLHGLFAVCREATAINFATVKAFWDRSRIAAADAKFRRLRYFAAFYWFSCSLALIAGIFLLSPLFFGLLASLLLPVMVFYNIMVLEMALLDIPMLFLRMKIYVCPSCRKKRILVPYCCPGCGKTQSWLRPTSKYGAFYRLCLCGEYIPASYLFGKGRMDGRCPGCSGNLTFHDAKFLFSKEGRS